MRWTMPIFALALAIALEAVGPMPGTQQGHAAGATRLALPSVANFSLFGSAQATTQALMLADAGGDAACPSHPAAVQDSAPQDNALLWAASLRGWSEGPTVRAWRRFVAWTKQAWRPAPPCGSTQASLG